MKQQHPMQHQPTISDRIIDELLRAVAFIIARDIDLVLLEKMAALPGDHPDLLAHLQRYNNQQHKKLRYDRRPVAKAVPPTAERTIEIRQAMFGTNYAGVRSAAKQLPKGELLCRYAARSVEDR